MSYSRVIEKDWGQSEPWRDPKAAQGYKELKVATLEGAVSGVSGGEL